MNRNIRLVFAGLVLVAATGTSARSQYYYPGGYGGGGWGFGGWDSTAAGGVLRGLGSYAQGAGVYNYDSAVAGSVNTDSYIRLNNYLYQSELEAQRRYAAHHASRLNMDKARYMAYQSRLRDNPSTEDIDSGAALNVLLHQFTDPKMTSGSGSSLRMADAKVPASSVREIPFRDETDAITISLDELTDSKSWPPALQGDEFKPEREAYQKAVDDALAEDKEGGTVKASTVTKVRSAVSQLYDKVEQLIPRTKQPDHLQATNYLKGLAGLSRMLERPNVEAALAELSKIENTTVGNLVAFMHGYNLRFDAAKTPKQVAVYRDLYLTMVAQRDKILGKPTEPSENGTSANGPTQSPTAVFHGFEPNQLYPGPSAPKANPVSPPSPRELWNDQALNFGRYEPIKYETTPPHSAGSCCSMHLRVKSASQSRYPSSYETRLAATSVSRSFLDLPDCSTCLEILRVLLNDAVRGPVRFVGESASTLGEGHPSSRTAQPGLF